MNEKEIQQKVKWAAKDAITDELIAAQIYDITSKNPKLMQILENIFVRGTEFMMKEMLKAKA